MAVWTITQQRQKTTVVFKNRKGEVFNVGDQHVDVEPRLLLDWMAVEADPGDIMVLNGRAVMAKLPEARA
jgi:hypothetical protein